MSTRHIIFEEDVPSAEKTATEEVNIEVMENTFSKKAITILLILIPFVVWFLLSLFKPGFVSKKKDKKIELNKKAALLWTLIITIIAYGGVYLLVYKGKGN